MNTTILAIKEAVRERDGFRCTDCGMTNAEHKGKHGRQLDVHRIVPGSRYTEEGCVTLCRSCHQKKPKSPYGSRADRGFLSIVFHNAARIRAQAKRFAVNVSGYVFMAVTRRLEADEQSQPAPPKHKR